MAIANAYIQTFETNVRHLSQQMESKLRGTTQEKGETGSKHNWERLGVLNASEKTTVRTPTPAVDSTWSRRVSIAKTYHIGTSTEQEDVVQMLTDPNGNLTRAVSSGMKRQFDDVIIAAATGSALDGAGAAVLFPAGQKIGTGVEVISFDLVTAVQEKFMQNNIDPSVRKFAIVGPTQVRKMMQMTENTSSDYVNAQALQQLNATGIVPNWMGFTWILSTRLLAPAAGQISCLFYTDQAIGVQVNRDISAKAAEDPSISFAYRIYSHMTLGATRVEDEQIVHLHLKNTMV